MLNSILLGVLVLTTCFGGYFQSNFTSLGNSQQITISSPETNEESKSDINNAKINPISAAISKKWTFMVYLDADNNLESAGIGDINEMEVIGSTTSMNVVVQIDRVSGYDTSNGDWTDTRRYYITSDTSPSIITSAGMTIGEKNMGDPTVLSDFITWSQTNYPADNYALILWDHGSGIMASSYQGGVCWDDSSSSDYLTIAEIQTAITGKNIQLLGFDACLMSSAEWFYSLNSYATTLVGSEKTEPGEGWPYDTILQWLNSNPTATSAQLGQQIVLKYMASYSTAYTVTQSAINSSKMTTVLSTASSFAQALSNNIGSYKNQISSIRDVVQEYDSEPYIDLYDFAYKVKSNIPSVATQADALMTAITNAVLQNGYSSGAAGSHGLTVYFPKIQGEFSNIYRNNAWSIGGLWDEFLLSYYGASISDDQFEDNDNQAQAATVYSKVYPGLVWSDDDWYNFTVKNGKTISVSLTFTHTTGVADLDIYLYNSGYSQLGYSNGSLNTESISWLVSGGDQTLYLWVDNYETGVGISYSLTVNIPIDDDAYENYDTRLTAYSMSSNNFTLPNLVAIDPDWFKFTVPDDCLVTVNLTFIAAQGILELQIYSSEDVGVTWKSLATINSAADNAFYQFGTWYTAISLRIAIGIINYENNTDYSLTVTTDPDADDSFEENDYLNANNDVSAQSYSDLVCIDYDFYNITLSQGIWLSVRITFKNSEGDLNLYVLNQTGDFVANSTYWEDNEWITYQIPSDGEFTIWIVPIEINLNYDLIIITNQTFWNDEYDENNDYMWQSSAFPQLTVGTMYENLSAWDEDFYALQLTAGVEYGFGTAYDDTTGTLVVYLYNSTFDLLAAQYNDLLYEIESTGKYYIRISPFQRLAHYTLYPYVNHAPSGTINVVLSGSLTIQCTELINSIDGVEWFMWDFGDGESAYGGNISHTYDALGTYEIYLTFNEYGEYWITSQPYSIRVWIQPVAFDLILTGGNPVNGTSFIINWSLDPLNVQSISVYVEYENFTSVQGFNALWTTNTETTRSFLEIINVENGTYFVCVTYSNPLGMAMSKVLQVIVGSGGSTDSGIAGYDLFLMIPGISTCLYLIYRKQRSTLQRNK